MMAAGLSSVTEQDLGAFLVALDRGELRAPLNATSLRAHGFGHLVETFQPYLELGPPGIRALIEVALAERQHRKAPKLTREPKPVVYFDPRTAEERNAVSLHAKCVVIDHEYTLITSANFTDRGQTRNLEAGVAIEDRDFASSLERQWLNLVEACVVVRG